MLLKNNPRVTVKPITVEDAKAFMGEDSPLPSHKGLSFFLDGELAAIAGIRFERGLFVVFSNIKSDIKVGRTTIFRCAQIVMKMCRSHGSSLYAICETDKSGRFLERLGWVKDFQHEGKWVYRI